MAFAESFLTLNGCKVRLRRGGKGRPLLYLHGANGVPAVAPFMETLAARFDVLAPEHPGFGASDEPEWLENIHDLAYFYLDFLEHLGLREVLLVGGSLGGWVALEMAVRDVSRLREMVLIGPSGLSVPGIVPGDIFLWSPEDTAKNLFHDPSHAEKMLAQPVTPEAVDLQLKNRHAVARLGWEPRLHDPFLGKWLHRVRVPVKLIWGEQDKVWPAAMAAEYAKRIPGAEVAIVPRCGHLPQIEKPQEFCELVFGFANGG
jgi:pimeloyl-ACP methyl ester carboxylesterase